MACDSTVSRGVIAPRSTSLTRRVVHNDPNNLEILRQQEESGGLRAGSFCCHTIG